jgi:acyl carrier protein
MSPQEVYDCFVEVANSAIKNDMLPQHLKDIELTPSIHLEDLGLDSISLVGLLAALSDETDSYFPDSLFYGNPTLWEIAERASLGMQS